MHLLVMQVMLWNAPDIFSTLSVICVSDALVKSADPVCQKDIALMMQKSLILCCILQCFVNFNILLQATKKYANHDLEIFTPLTPPRKTYHVHRFPSSMHSISTLPCWIVFSQYLESGPENR